MTSTLTVCFDFFSQDTIRSKSRTVQLYVFLEIIWQQSFKGTHANVFRKMVCISLSISSATVASHEIFHLPHMSSGNFARVGDRISLKRLRARPAVYGFHLPCNLRQLSKPWSPPADMTMSKISPSVRADNTTKSCTTISADVSTPSSGTPIATVADVNHVLCLSCKRQSTTHVREHARHVVLNLLGPHIEMFFSS